MAPLQPLATFEATEPSDLTPADEVVFNGFYAYQTCRTDAHIPIPQGWHRHDNISSRDHFYTMSEKYLGDYRFGFPLPIADPTQPATYPSVDSVLLCTAPVADVQLIDADGIVATNTAYAVKVCAGDLTASLFLRQTHHCGDTLQSSHTELQSIQLAAISRAEVADADRLRDWFYYRLMDFKPLGVPRFIAESKPFYNVLWVEWDGDAAYRKILGIMSMEEWNFWVLSSRPSSLGKKQYCAKSQDSAQDDKAARALCNSVQAVANFVVVL